MTWEGTETVGEQAGGRGPNAALYAVVPSSAYVAGLHVEHDEVSARVADITGQVVTEPTAAGAVQAAVAAARAGDHRGDALLTELAARVATGVAAVCVVLDPGLVVLGGEVGRAGASALAERVAAEVGRICPARPTVVPTGVTGGPVLRGAILAAVDQARSELLASVAGP